MLMGHPVSSATLPFDRAHTTSYSNLIETMRLSRTVFKILSLIFQKLKRSGDSNHATFRDNCRPKAGTCYDQHARQI